jgi:DNA replication and repair protein RecF
MYLTHLSLTNFRNFARLDMDIPRRLILLIGRNAQGKTSLLEAIYYFATFTSFHTQTDRQLINFLTLKETLPVARLVADYQRGAANHRMEVRLILEQNGGNGSMRLRREILLDGVKRNASEVIGHFTAVIFLPQMSRIIEGSPEDRRRYLNLVLSQVVPHYAQDLTDYNQAITQRNALLKQLFERGGDTDQLVYWDEILCDRGARIMAARIHAIQEIERIAARLHSQLTGDQEVLRMVYLPAYEPLPARTGQFELPIQTPIDRSGLGVEQIAKGFAQKLLSVRSEEIARGVTTIGPHRDNLSFLSNGIDLEAYGSRGQIRSTLLAVKLAEMIWMKEKTGQSPVLLLDEMMAELDLRRRAYLLKYLVDSEQALLTATDPGMFAEDFLQSAIVWQVESGGIKST